MNVIARYVTAQGANVELTEDPSTYDCVDSIHCTGCDWHSGWTYATYAHEDAQDHAQACTAQPNRNASQSRPARLAQTGSRGTAPATRPGDP